MRRTLYALLTLILLPGSVFAVFYYNGSPVAFNTTSNNSTSGGLKEISASGITLDSKVAQAAAFFLKSYSDFALALQRYEQNASDFPGIQEALTASIANMKEANTLYDNIYRTASQTAYNPSVIYQLSAFDYTGFQKSKNLLSDLFQKVKAYLIRGDVTGTYGEVFSRTSDLLNQLNLIKNDMNYGTIPDVTKLWEINQRFIFTLLFGQYESMVFKALK